MTDFTTNKSAKGFLANTTKLMSGNVFAEIVAVCAIPVITRLFTVSTYGNFMVFLALGLSCLPISTFCYHLAILIPKELQEARKLLILSHINVATFSVILATFICFWKDLLLDIIGAPDLGKYIYWLPIMVFIHGSYLSQIFWNIRQRRYGKTSLAKALESISDRGSVITVALLGFNSIGILIMGRILSGTAALLYLLKNSSRKQAISTTGLLTIVKKYRHFAIYNIPSTIISGTLPHLPIIIISYFYSPGIAGLYALGNRIVAMPAQLLGDALSKTYFQHTAQNSDNQEKVKVNTLDLFDILFMFLLVPFTLLCATGGKLFAFVLGTAWSDAGVFIQILAFLALTTFLARTFGNLFDVYGKQHIRLCYQSTNFIIRIGALCAGGFFIGIKSCLLIYSVAATLMNLVAILILFSYVGTSYLEMVLKISKHILRAAPFMICIMIISHITSNPYLMILFLSLISFTWLFYLTINNDIVKTIFLNAIRKISSKKAQMK